MNYFSKQDIYYTAAGIVTVSATIVVYSVLASLGWFGWVLNFLMLLGMGAVLGQFFQTWHIDYKFSQELDGFEDSLREALEAKKTDQTP